MSEEVNHKEESESSNGYEQWNKAWGWMILQLHGNPTADKAPATRKHTDIQSLAVTDALLDAKFPLPCEMQQLRHVPSSA